MRFGEELQVANVQVVTLTEEKRVLTEQLATIKAELEKNVAER